VALDLPTVAESKAMANKEKKTVKKKTTSEVVVVRQRRSSGGSSSSSVLPTEGQSPNTMLAAAEAKGRTKAKTTVKVPEPRDEEGVTTHNETKPASKATPELDPVDYGPESDYEGLGDLGDPAV
jgi:hypothetical protein